MSAFYLPRPMEIKTMSSTNKWAEARDTIEFDADDTSFQNSCCCSALTSPPCAWCERSVECHDCGELEIEWAEVEGCYFCWTCLDRRAEEFEANRPRGFLVWLLRLFGRFLKRLRDLVERTLPARPESPTSQENS